MKTKFLIATGIMLILLCVPFDIADKSVTFEKHCSGCKDPGDIKHQI